MSTSATKGNLKKITLLKTLWFAVIHYYRQEQIPQVSPTSIKHHHHQLQLGLRHITVVSIMFDNLKLIHYCKVKGFVCHVLVLDSPGHQQSSKKGSGTNREHFHIQGLHWVPIYILGSLFSVNVKNGNLICMYYSQLHLSLKLTFTVQSSNNNKWCIFLIAKSHFEDSPDTHTGWTYFFHFRC